MAAKKKNTKELMLKELDEFVAGYPVECWLLWFNRHNSDTWIGVSVFCDLVATVALENQENRGKFGHLYDTLEADNTALLDDRMKRKASSDWMKLLETRVKEPTEEELLRWCDGNWTYGPYYVLDMLEENAGTFPNARVDMARAAVFEILNMLERHTDKSDKPDN
jgi:hypothetical protein